MAIGAGTDARASPEADEETRHVRGIASDVVLDGRAREALKRYRRQPLIAALYRVAFQAPFPYVSNVAALKAAKYRRRIAGLVTKYLLGRDVIAQVRRVEAVEGGYVFVTELVDGGEPTDRRRARAFLHEVTDAFIKSGLPTWQVSPHNPRSLGNVMETRDGDYKIIDLESNVVTPMVPLRELWGAARTMHLPPFDDIDIPKLLRFVSDNWKSIRMRLGEDDAHELARSIARYAWYEELWQKNEPRLWSRALRRLTSTLDVPAHVRGLAGIVRGWSAGGGRLAERWAQSGIDRWANEGLISEREAQRARDDLQSGPIIAVLGHLGAQLAMSVPLRFPLGSAARFLWASVFRLRAEVRAMLHRATPDETRAARGIHSVAVIAASAVPGLGAAAYVLARPLRRNQVLLGATLDQAFRMLPLHLYERFHLRPVTIDIARRDGIPEPGLSDRLRSIPAAMASLAEHRLIVAAAFALNGAALAGATAYAAATRSVEPFENYSFIGMLTVGEALVAGLLGIAYYRRFWARPGGDERPGAAGTLFWLGGGLALVWLAFDEFFHIHEAVGGRLDGIPLIEHTDDLVLLAYLVCGVVFVRTFGHEVESHGPSLVLLGAALLMAAATVAIDLLEQSGTDWTAVENATQLLTVAFILPAFVIKHRELTQRRE